MGLIEKGEREGEKKEKTGGIEIICSNFLCAMEISDPVDRNMLSKQQIQSHVISCVLTYDSCCYGYWMISVCHKHVVRVPSLQTTVQCPRDRLQPVDMSQQNHVLLDHLCHCSDISIFSGMVIKLMNS